MLRPLKRAIASTQDIEVKTMIVSAIKNCREAINRLSTVLENLQRKLASKQSDKLSAKAKAFVYRAFFPFKKETIASLKASVAESLQHLNPALEMLQM